MSYSEKDSFQWMERYKSLVQDALITYLPVHDLSDLDAAMRYSVLNGGKCIRALLVYASGEFCAEDENILLFPAMAVELVHSYSLVHDDLPCMDDDDWRRGMPSCHKKYGEALALLVGDALQSLAFEILSIDIVNITPTLQRQWVNLLAKVIGAKGMVKGQAIDIFSTGLNLSQAALQEMHENKTGALIRGAVLMGCLGKLDQETIYYQVLDRYAKKLGLLFQIMDDVRDVEGIDLGKTLGKDEKHGKATYVALLGLKQAKVLAKQLLDEIIDEITLHGKKAEKLIDLAQLVGKI